MHKHAILRFIQLDHLRPAHFLRGRLDLQLDLATSSCLDHHSTHSRLILRRNLLGIGPREVHHTFLIASLSG